MSEEKVAARYVQWGRGKWHAWEVGGKTTACGMTVPDRVRQTIYKPAVCAKCQKAAPDLVAAAEETRQRDAERASDYHAERLERNRAGEFTVFRCRTCGQQLSAGSGNRACVPPNDPLHSSDPEEVVVRGPAWEQAT